MSKDGTALRAETQTSNRTNDDDEDGDDDDDDNDDKRSVDERANVFGFFTPLHWQD